MTVKRARTHVHNFTCERVPCTCVRARGYTYIIIHGSTKKKNLEIQIRKACRVFYFFIPPTACSYPYTRIRITLYSRAGEGKLFKFTYNAARATTRCTVPYTDSRGQTLRRPRENGIYTFNALERVMYTRIILHAHTKRCRMSRWIFLIFIFFIPATFLALVTRFCNNKIRIRDNNSSTTPLRRRRDEQRVINCIKCET
jgi:hypothetical protein